MTRPIELVREEIGDLEGYLAAIPVALREGVPGEAYRCRLAALLTELAELDIEAGATDAQASSG